jgi:thiamine-phosphate pyrophosphorylase
MAVKSYLITDPEYYGSSSESVYEATVNAIYKHHPYMACFRDKTTNDYEALATAFMKAVRSVGGTRVFLHSHIEIAAKVGAEGVHLASTQLGDIAKAKAQGLDVIVSCHTLEEIETAKRNGADAVTYSPVFATPGKGSPKGLEDLKEIVGKIDLNIYALGGITTPEQVKQIADTGVYGFASIRYFL